VIHNAFHGIGIEAVLGSLPGFINVDADFLMSDLIESLPTSQVVLEVLESVDPSPSIVTRIRDLKKRGYKFALDDYIGEAERYAALLPEMDVFKLDLMQIPALHMTDIVTALRQYPGKLLAEKVESKRDFQRTRALNFDYYQGFHFAHPEMMSSRELQTSAPTELLKLLTLLTSNADLAHLVNELKRHPALSYNLIRIANSSAIGASQKISSIHEAALILGRRQMLHVVQVLLYAAQGGSAQNNPLLQMAIVRSRLMEDLAAIVEESSSEFVEAAFLTGTLSLLDVLFNIPLEAVLSALPVADNVRDALLHRAGKLGSLLRLCEHLDQQDEAGLERELDAVPEIRGHNLIAMQLDAFAWGQNLGI
jgi:EAL and modified HD-GYP domain-containing signal transduction protein